MPSHLIKHLLCWRLGLFFTFFANLFFHTAALSLIICFHLQENGTDGPIQALRDAIQKLERDGMIDFDLGGHQFSRPADVMQGNSADRLVWFQHGMHDSMHHL